MGTPNVLTPIYGGFHIRERADGKACIDVMRMMYNWRLVLAEIEPGRDVHEGGYIHGWCYFGFETPEHPGRNMDTALATAVAAALVWDGVGEPVGYDKKVM